MTVLWAHLKEVLVDLTERCREVKDAAVVIGCTAIFVTLGAVCKAFI